MSGQRVEQAIRRANLEGRPALTAFLTAGYPHPERFVETLRSVAGVADVIEVGVPFSDPMADGVTIQKASRAALEAGVTLPWILAETQRAGVSIPILLMSYLNPLLAIGLPELCATAAGAGVDGLIVPDLPYEESLEVLATLEPAGLGLVQFVTPLTPPERMAAVCDRSSGFVYAVTRTGTTGGPFDLAGAAEMLARVRRVCTLPVQAGFGIREPDQVRELAPLVDGVIVGSALVERLERHHDPVPFLRSLRDATRRSEALDSTGERR